MKVDLIRKYRWYIVGLIMSFIMISLSLSFCIWDNNGLKSLSASGGSGDYKHVPAYKLAEADDKYKDDNLNEGKNGIANVGDIVTFGNYYQGTNEIEKTPLRWIVVNSENGTLTLLAESVLAFGSFDYRYYCTGGEWQWEGEEKYNQCYNDSAIRAWLNSGQDWDGDGIVDDRSDGGIGFANDDRDKKVFNGFYREAFESREQNAIISRNLGSMIGYSVKNNYNKTLFEFDPLKNQKVWIPSWTEVYGTTSNPWEYGKVLDATGDKQFSYFSGVFGYDADQNKVGKTTQFASTAYLSNYTTKAATHQGNSQGAPWNSPPYDVTAGSVTPAWWWLRSPFPGNTGYAFMVDVAGNGSGLNSFDSHGGVRPAVCVAR